jgi:uncharacterized protein (DUF3820 family)
MTLDPVIPFGKHKGKHASEIEVEYLDWLLGQDWFIDKFTKISEEVLQHLKTRQDWKNL